MISVFGIFSISKILMDIIVKGLLVTALVNFAVIIITGVLKNVKEKKLKN